MTHRERILAAIRGEMPDRLPFAPRLELWHIANSRKGTLPEKYRNSQPDEIARAEGWALHKINPEYQKPRSPEDFLHWGLGIMSCKETVYGYQMPGDVDVEVESHEGETKIVYHTPVGTVSSTVVNTEEMRRSGVSNFWVKEHVLKEAKDYRPVGYIYQNLKLFPDPQDFLKWRSEIGEDGVPFSLACRSASPVHHIQKHMVDATDFFYQYHDNAKEMQGLAESISHFFERVLALVADSPAEVVFWGANFDDMITYPSYFSKEIRPWIERAAGVLGAKGKFVSCHCDGENQGLMDLIRDSGVHVAEAVCPWPMTKVKIDDYYRRWTDKLTIFGGIPSILLLKESTSEESFEEYLDSLFEAIAPGRRMILGVADSVPPAAVYERIVRIGERAAKEGRLPLKAGGYRPVSGSQLAQPAPREKARLVWDKEFKIIQKDVFEGDQEAIKGHIADFLAKGMKAEDILKRGLLTAMEAIGERFKTGEVFIPEVLLSARAMNEATAALEPYLSSSKVEAKGRVLIGTVKGDLHDIGKNLVVTMLRGVGFEVHDLGINVEADVFTREVERLKPDILGLSALLTTTMPQMKIVIEALNKRGLRGPLKIMVGGAPVNEKFARDIGADGYAPDGAEGITLARKMMVS